MAMLQLSIATLSREKGGQKKQKATKNLRVVRNSGVCAVQGGGVDK